MSFVVVHAGIAFLAEVAVEGLEGLACRRGLRGWEGLESLNQRVMLAHIEATNKTRSAKGNSYRRHFGDFVLLILEDV